jgi:hypothetical protein
VPERLSGHYRYCRFSLPYKFKLKKKKKKPVDAAVYTADAWALKLINVYTADAWALNVPRFALITRQP